MADLQEELQRFLTARFGVDVKDAFVSCIQKIHKENQEVAALEQPMKDATQQVLDIREEITAVSQNASKTAEDAKTIARAAESNASQALATAKNAKDDAFNAAGDAELAMAAAQQVEQNYTTMELMLSGKVDGHSQLLTINKGKEVVFRVGKAPSCSLVLFIRSLVVKGIFSLVLPIADDIFLCFRSFMIL